MDELLTLIGLVPAGWRLPEAVRVNGWIVTAAVAAVAALTRLLNLSHPRTLMFDEIYYAKDAYALWHNGYESSWSEGADELFATGDVSALTTDPSYIVHPQLGKWLIGLGMEVFGVNSLGWRIVPAIAGILTVIVLTRLTLRLTRSPLLAGLAGLLLAIDGVAITESRIALLDGFIGLFGLLTLYCLVRDRQWSRARLARDLAGTPPNHLAPRAHLRPWLLAAGVCLGLTCSIKWSGLYLLAAVGILVVVWDTLALRRVRAKAWFLEGVIARGFGDFLRLVPVALVVYVAGWCSWFAHDKAYKHGWAATEEATHGSVARSWLPDPLNDLVEYHLTMYDFHVNLSSEHPYMASPFGWLLQLRPTSFYWPDAETLEGTACPTDHCIQAITSIGNIAVWWAALPALVLAVAGLAWRRRDWRVWVPLIAYVGLYLPWFGYLDRTIFTFYTVAFAPAVVLVLTLVLGSASGMLRPVPGGREAREEARLLEGGLIGEGKAHPRGPIAGYLGFGQHPTRLRIPEAWSGVPPWRIHTEGIVLTAVIVAAALVFAALWWPIWTGQTVTYEFWHWHMLLPSWI
ncbi:MAG: phospholipid carrier-dependent glycosyltransferase [Actinomyces sp.]|uniref:dolichyl-phosphate-mannose--protein mannosyltransferase n=1 Tax=Actinomyces sp. TaxID=29317 RepID=UPI0026DAE2C5|nr:phospholipid carrier-dependent glycosyltransferase [Actinomyces sp.]MDO4243503.1 phospholipid carrier-dependent glycosyltransferase [Actinomyces sp.]